MSALGQKRTFRAALGMSALPPKSGHLCSRLKFLKTQRSVRCRGPSADGLQPKEKSNLSKFGEQSVCVFEILRVKAFGKAAIGGTKDIERFGALALFHPEPGQVGGCAKLKRSCLLAACRSQSLFEKSLGLGVRSTAHEQRACL